MSGLHDLLRLLLGAPVLCAAAGLPAQRLTLQPSLASPGAPVQASLHNDSGSTIFYVKSCEVRTLRHSGELWDVSSGYPSPRSVLPTENCDQVVPLPPGATWNFFINAPSAPGSYTVITADLVRVAARLDVVAPTPGAQDICFYPNGIWLPQTAHEIDFDRPDVTAWEFAHTGATTHEFGPGDVIRILMPGTTTVVASRSLAGITVAARAVRPVALPVGGLTPGPYTVEATFTDPAAGTVVTRAGIQPRGVRADLHLYDGHDLVMGGELGMSIGVTGFSVAEDDPTYFLLVGFLPGATPLPGGVQIPLDLADPVVQSSFFTGLGGLQVHHVGLVSNINLTGNPFFAGGVDDIRLAWPLLPGLRGVRLRLGVLVVNVNLNTWGASQPEEIVLR